MITAPLFGSFLAAGTFPLMAWLFVSVSEDFIFPLESAFVVLDAALAATTLGSLGYPWV